MRGIVGLGGGWRAATEVWGAPAIIGATILAAGVSVWAILAILLAARATLARGALRAELNHPVQGGFAGLVGVSTMLVALAVQPYASSAAAVLFGAGAFVAISFAFWRTGGLWRGGRGSTSTTPVLYCPTVASGFVGASGLAFGLPHAGQVAFGCGLLSWLAIESVLLQRLYNGPELAPALRPTLGIQLAPPGGRGLAL